MYIYTILITVFNYFNFQCKNDNTKIYLLSITIYKGDYPFCVHVLKYQFYPLNIVIY